MKCPICNHPDYYEGLFGPSCANPNCGDGRVWAPKVTNADTKNLIRARQDFRSSILWPPQTDRIAPLVSNVRALLVGEIALVPATAYAAVLIRNDLTPVVRPKYATSVTYPDEFVIRQHCTFSDPAMEHTARGYAEQGVADQEGLLLISLLRISAELCHNVRRISAPRDGGWVREFDDHCARGSIVLAGVGLRRRLIDDACLTGQDLYDSFTSLYFTKLLAPLEMFILRTFPVSRRSPVSLFERRRWVETSETKSPWPLMKVTDSLQEAMIVTDPDRVTHLEYA